MASWFGRGFDSRQLHHLNMQYAERQQIKAKNEVCGHGRDTKKFYGTTIKLFCVFDHHVHIGYFSDIRL